MKIMIFLEWLLMWMAVPFARGRVRFHSYSLHRANYVKCIGDFVRGVSLEKQLGISHRPINLPQAGCSVTANPFSNPSNSVNFTCLFSRETHVLPHCTSGDILLTLDCFVCHAFIAFNPDDNLPCIILTFALASTRSILRWCVDN